MKHTAQEPYQEPSLRWMVRMKCSAAGGVEGGSGQWEVDYIILQELRWWHEGQGGGRRAGGGAAGGTRGRGVVYRWHEGERGRGRGKRRGRRGDKEEVEQ